MTTLIRTPLLLVYFGGVYSGQRHSFEVSNSLDQIYAEGTIHCPLGVPSGVGLESKVKIVAGGSIGGAQTRFTGRIAGFGENLYPTGITFKVEGKFGRAARTKPKTPGGVSLVGMTPAEAITFMLTESGIDAADLDIGGDEPAMGSTVDPSSDARFLWGPKLYASQMISALELASDGWRTYETPEGRVKREKVDKTKKNRADFTFTEGVDMYIARLDVTAPFPVDQSTSMGPEGKSHTTNLVTTEIPPELEPNADAFWSPFFESSTEAEGVGLSTERSSRYRASQKSKNEVSATIVTHRDDLIEVNKRVRLRAPTRMETDVILLVQTVRVSIDQAGHWEQQLELIGELDHRKPDFTPPDVIPEFTVEAVDKESVIVGGVASDLWTVACTDASTSVTGRINSWAWSAPGGTIVGPSNTDRLLVTYTTDPSGHSISLTVGDDKGASDSVTHALTAPVTPATEVCPLFAASYDSPGTFEAFDGTTWRRYDLNGPYICVANGPAAGQGTALTIPGPGP